MKSFLSKLFSSRTARPQLRTTVKRTGRLNLEALEDRTCPSGVSLQLAQLYQAAYGTATAVTVLHNQIMSDSIKLSADAFYAELSRPTPLGATIAHDALKLNSDAGAANSSLVSSSAVFTDTLTLLTHMAQEKIQYGSQSLMVSNSGVYADACTVFQDMEINAAFAQANNLWRGTSYGTTYNAYLGFAYITSPSQTTTIPTTSNTDTANYATYNTYSSAVSSTGFVAVNEAMGL